MYQKDYILRMIEMMAELVAAVLGFIKKGNYQQASRALEKASTSFSVDKQSRISLIQERIAHLRNLTRIND
jgi:hypothetical protein